MEIEACISRMTRSISKFVSSFYSLYKSLSYYLVSRGNYTRHMNKVPDRSLYIKYEDLKIYPVERIFASGKYDHFDANTSSALIPHL